MSTLDLLDCKSNISPCQGQSYESLEEDLPKCDVCNIPLIEPIDIYDKIICKKCIPHALFKFIRKQYLDMENELTKHRFLGLDNKLRNLLNTTQNMSFNKYIKTVDKILKYSTKHYKELYENTDIK